MIENFIYFEFGKVFNFERGQRFTKEEHINGDTPYISSTKEKNGIDCYVLPPKKTKKGIKIKIYNNKIGLNNSGSVGYCFYHNYDFIASDHVTVIDIKTKYKQQLTLNIALFLKPIIEKLKTRYSFGREISNNRLKKEMIYLPYKIQNNEKVPDWEFMENYIQAIGKKVEWSNKYITNTYCGDKKIDTTKWVEFDILQIFPRNFGNNYTRGKEQISECENDGTPLVSSTAKNNGIVGYKQNVIHTFNHNSITLANNGSVGSLFYQNKNFCATQDVTILSRCNLNKYIALFLITILKQEKYRYSYGRKWGNDKLAQTKIKLPAKTDNNGNLLLDKDNNPIPDWEFMENYIKSLPYSSSL